jgi:hypothetical protein
VENNSVFLGGFDGRIWNIIWKPNFFKNLLRSHFKIDFHKIFTIKESILYTFTVYLEIIFWVIKFKYIKCNILCLMVIYMIKFISDLKQVVVFSWYSGFLHQWNWPPRYNWNIVESGIKRHSPIMWTYTMSSLNNGTQTKDIVCFSIDISESLLFGRISLFWTETTILP